MLALARSPGRGSSYIRGVPEGLKELKGQVACWFEKLYGPVHQIAGGDLSFAQTVVSETLTKGPLKAHDLRMNLWRLAQPLGN